MATSLMNAMRAKCDLAARLPMDEAFEVFCALSELDAAHALRRRPLCDLGAVLEAEAAEPVIVLNPGGEPRVNRAPEIHGPGHVPELRNTGRRILAGWLEDATVFARSALVARGEELLRDAQHDELTSLPEELAFDPVVFRRTGAAEVAFIEDTGPGRCLHLPRALSLLGINADSFGHWMLEQLPRFLATRALLGAATPPLLVDADIPAQHAEALRFFGGEDGPEIIEVPRGLRVRVDRLFCVLDWAYAPHLITTDEGLDVSKVHAVVPWVAGVYAQAGARADARIAELGVAVAPQIRVQRRVFWARKPARHRSIANWEALRDRLDGLGYVTVFPEEMGFAAQVATLRAADRIVVQNGSGSLGLPLARPGTRVLYLSHPEMSRFAWQSEAFACLGFDLRVLSGPFTERSQPWVDQSNYEIEMPVAEAALAWMEADLPHGRGRAMQTARPRP
ncbi:glycosyltransferase family 61 protein [Dinoroseobacter sp. PD6]|uniref:glycosyltransferase family 61 protein n=1 Tax=Dinoroseobacter sp. PD6 TaxID=3028384 RepID=UPI00237C093A|nr:glycosyltransferase family 61 protein [Dinoroseobacter sp. PD6]MDD9718292.1 glycosyltransferase family 61 protein [Dinoroseobacter sp. PD6]